MRLPWQKLRYLGWRHIDVEGKPYYFQLFERKVPDQGWVKYWYAENRLSPMEENFLSKGFRDEELKEEVLDDFVEFIKPQIYGNE